MDDASAGRELKEHYRHLNESMADQLHVGQQVQFHLEGWRFGIVSALPLADEKKYGQVRIEHKSDHHYWIDGRDIKPLTMDWDAYRAWQKGE
jgi:hypothetical protein